MEVKVSPRLGPGSDGLTGGFLEEGGKWGSRGNRNEVLPTSCRDIRATVGMEVSHSWTAGGTPALETVLVSYSHHRECTRPPFPQHTDTQEKGSPSRIQPLVTPSLQQSWGGVARSACRHQKAG